MTRQIPPKGSRSRGPFIYVIRRSRPDGLVGVVCGRGRNPPMSFFKWEDVKILSPCCRHGGLCCRGDAVGSRAEPRWRRSINLPFADWIPQERFSSRPTSHYATHGRRVYPAHRILGGLPDLALRPRPNGAMVGSGWRWRHLMSDRPDEAAQFARDSRSVSQTSSRIGV